MNYHHGYHAGSFTDVFKHVILVALIKALLRKEKAFCYLDTHAGAGCYDLFSAQAQKSQEFESGISKVLHEKNPPDLIKQYLNCVQKINNQLTGSSTSALRYYPGSPAIMHYFLRPQDRMVLTELHPQEQQLLKNYFANASHTSVHLLDGYQGLKAFLPPPERRSLILLDPPYEKPYELSYLASLLPIALKRFTTGIYAIWYPIKDRLAIEHFQQTLQQTIQQPLLVTEMTIYPEESPVRLNGCGMIIINPPWQLDTQLLAYLPWLWKILSPYQQGQYRIAVLPT
jgi:23S rRNA (adenine2030-N6)-methyltransferase